MPITLLMGGDAPGRSEHLEALLEVARIVHSDRELRDVLPDVMATLARAFGYGIVVLNLFRPATQDIECTVVYGGGAAGAETQGTATPLSAWAPLFDERFASHGCYVIPAGEMDWSDWSGEVVYAEDAVVSDDPDRWHPEDVLLIPLEARDGSLLGVIAVDDPASRLRPTPSDLRVLAAVGAHTALAIEQRNAAVARARYLTAIEQLLERAGTLPGADDVDSVVETLVDGVASVLEFRRVAVAVPEAGGYRIVASQGWPAGELDWIQAAPAALVERRLSAGRSLGPTVVLEPRPLRAPVTDAPVQGWGPEPWRGETLVLRMCGADGGGDRLLLVAEPFDGCMPASATLGALRMFADQAALAVVAAARLELVRHEAAHDALTELGNRRSLHATLGRLGGDRARFALLVLDLDGFKAVNDSLGHAAGDELLTAVAGAIRANLRRDDRAFRLGGDEFAIVLHDATPAETTAVRQRLEAAIATLDIRGARVGASIGVATSAGTDDAGALLELADARMYEAKRRHGRRLADVA